MFQFNDIRMYSLFTIGEIYIWNGLQIPAISNLGLQNPTLIYKFLPHIGVYSRDMFFLNVVIRHFSLTYMQFCFLLCPCFSITYSIIVCLGIKLYNIIRYACKFAYTKICVHMDLYGNGSVKILGCLNGGGGGYKFCTPHQYYIFDPNWK